MAVRLFQKGDLVRRKPHCRGDKWWRSRGLGARVFKVMETQKSEDDFVMVENAGDYPGHLYLSHKHMELVEINGGGN